MSDGNVRVRKYDLIFEIELYGASASEAFARGLDLQRQVVERLVKLRVAEVFDRLDLPSGGIDGAPHTFDLDGWRCVYTLREHTD